MQRNSLSSEEISIKVRKKEFVKTRRIKENKVHTAITLLEEDT